MALALARLRSSFYSSGGISRPEGLVDGRTRGGGGAVEAGHSDESCPACLSGDVPKLIVRGTGKGSHGTSLQCRRCGHEWSDEESWSSQAS
jgi:hypothetical protein